MKRQCKDTIRDPVKRVERWAGRAGLTAARFGRRGGTSTNQEFCLSRVNDAISR